MAEAPAATFRHPSPHKDRTSISAQLFGFTGGPIAWTGQLLICYGLTSYACYPGPVPRSSVLPGWSLLGPALTIFDGAAFALAAAALFVSYRIYTMTRSEMRGETHDLLDVGEGRTRFLAFCGLLTAAGFALVIVFNTLSLYLVPPCTR